MKKIWLVAFVFLNAFLYAELLPDVDLSTSYKMNLNDFKESQFAARFKILWPNLKSHIFFSEENMAAALSVSANLSKEVSLSFKAGHLTSSGSFLKLASPALSSIITPFYEAAVSPLVFSAALPGFDSFNKPFSFTSSFNYESKVTLLQKASTSLLFNLQDTGPLFILYNLQTIKPRKNLELNFSETIELWTCKEKDFTTWYNSLPYFDKTKLFSGNFQGGFKTKINGLEIQNLSTINILETPFYKAGITEENAFKLQFGKLKFNADFFYNGNEKLITASSKVLEKQLQGKYNFNSSFLLGTNNPLLVTTGLTFFHQNQIENKSSVYKETVGFKYASKNSGGNFYLNAKTEVQNKTVKNFQIGGNINETIKLKSCSLSGGVAAEFEINPIAKNVEVLQKYKISFYHGGKFNISGNGSLEIEHKNRLLKTRKLECSLNARFKLKKIGCTCKAGAAIEF